MVNIKLLIVVIIMFCILVILSKYQELTQLSPIPSAEIIPRIFENKHFDGGE